MDRELIVVSYTKKNEKLWNAFISKAKNSTFLFYRDFMEYHSDRFEDFSLMVFKDEKLLAVLPANRVNDTLYSHQGLTYGGLIYNENLKFPEVLECFKEILHFLNSEEIKTLEIKLLPSIYSQFSNDELNYLMFLLENVLALRHVLTVNLVLVFYSKKNQNIVPL